MRYEPPTEDERRDQGNWSGRGENRFPIPAAAICDPHASGQRSRRDLWRGEIRLGAVQQLV